MEHNGNADRWNEIRARRERDEALEQLANAVNAVFIKPDPIEAFAAAVSRRTPPKRQSRIDGAAMIREGQAALNAITAGRAERERRNGPVARRAFDLWQQARAVYAEEHDDGYEFEPTLQPVIAASLHISPGEFVFYCPHRMTPRV